MVDDKGEECIGCYLTVHFPYGINGDRCRMGKNGWGGSRVGRVVGCYTKED